VTRVLVVDDDEDNLNLFTIVLENVGFKVNSYSDPVQVLKEFKTSYHDLLILDYLMPSLNGFELYKRIRQADESIKVLILTASQEQVSFTVYSSAMEALAILLLLYNRKYPILHMRRT
jgi:CheY-like chemotaxis protein